MTSAKLIASSIPGIEPVRSDRKLLEVSSRPSSSSPCGLGSTSCQRGTSSFKKPCVAAKAYIRAFSERRRGQIFL